MRGRRAGSAGTPVISAFAGQKRVGGAVVVWKTQGAHFVEG